MGFDLGEFEFTIVGIHTVDLFTSRGSQNFDNFYQLVNS
jgi:hypothetical protein